MPEPLFSAPPSMPLTAAPRTRHWLLPQGHYVCSNCQDPKNLAQMPLMPPFDLPAAGQLQRFDSPKTASGLAVDFCREYGTDCGQLAAAAWCVSQEYTGAAEFGGPVDVPMGTMTAFPLDPSVKCNTTSPSHCRTFSYILCYRV